jgi:hypothetical protein
VLRNHAEATEGVDGHTEVAFRFTTQQSQDILSYQLKQNGLPAGNQPLADTVQLSDVLPAH